MEKCKMSFILFYEIHNIFPRNWLQALHIYTPQYFLSTYMPARGLIAQKGVFAFKDGNYCFNHVMFCGWTDIQGVTGGTD